MCKWCDLRKGWSRWLILLGHQACTVWTLTGVWQTRTTGQALQRAGKYAETQDELHVHMKLHSLAHDLRTGCGSAPRPGRQEVSKTDAQLLHSWDFHDVLCRLACLNNRVTCWNRQDAPSTRHVCQPASKKRKIVRVCSWDVSQIPGHKNCAANVNSEFIVERGCHHQQKGNNDTENVERTIEKFHTSSVISQGFLPRRWVFRWMKRRWNTKSYRN